MNTPNKWPGKYFDGQTPIPQLAQVEIRDGTLEISTINNVHLAWELQNLQQTQGHYPGEEVRLEHRSSSGEVLVIDDFHFLTALHQLAPHHVRHFHDPRTRRRRIWMTIGAGIMSLPLLWILYAHALPNLAASLTHLIPYSWERELGTTLLNELAPHGSHCSNPRLQEKVDALMNAMIGTIGENPHRFQVTIVDQPDMNALALPGGHIIVYRGLLLKTETPEELAGVLAHEVQHILQHHSTRLLVQNMTIELLLGALTGDVSGIMAFVLEGAQLLQSRSYSRATEEEADQKGVGLLIGSGIDPKGMLNFFGYFQQQQNPQSTNALWKYLSTHPPPPDRIENLETLVGQSGKSYRPLFPLDDWKQLVLLCKDGSASPAR